MPARQQRLWLELGFVSRTAALNAATTSLYELTAAWPVSTINKRERRCVCVRTKVSYVSVCKRHKLETHSSPYQSHKSSLSERRTEPHSRRAAEVSRSSSQQRR